MKTYKEAIKILDELDISSVQIAEILCKFTAIIYEKSYDSVVNDYCNLTIDKYFPK